MTVAVKTITFQDHMCHEASGRGGGQTQHRAIMEAAISASLAHPNIVTTYSYDIKPLFVQNNNNNNAAVADGCLAGGNGDSGSGLVVSQAQATDWKMYIIQVSTALWDLWWIYAFAQP